LFYDANKKNKINLCRLNPIGIHPQLLKYNTSAKPEWFLKLIQKYPTAEKLSRASVKSISKIPSLTEDKAKLLRKEAKQSIASLEAEGSDFITTSIVSQIILLQKTIKVQKETLIKKMKLTHSKEIELLTSFIGIGDYSVTGLLLKIGDIKRFPSAKHLASYFGLHPIFRESGDKKKGNHMSKQGSVEARRLLFNIVFSAINHNLRIKELYDEYVKKGKAKLSAVGILMHKVTRMIYGMLTNKTQYDADIDRMNVIKYKKRKTNPKISKNRRFQDFDNNAPISTRHRKKIKNEEDERKLSLQQAESQNDNIIQCGIITPAENNLQ